MSFTLSEFESKALLADAGVPIPVERLVDTPEAAAEAAEQLGYPVAIKLCGRGIAHKTERGLVRLGLTDSDDVQRHAEALLEARREDERDAKLLVSPMIQGRRELIAGLVRDPQFGPCVMIGLGGIFAEALDDVAFAVAPLRRHDAEELIGALEHQKVLGSLRGEPPVDRVRLGTMLETLGQIGIDRPDVRSIDLNPLIVVGDRPVVADALVELEEDSGE